MSEEDKIREAYERGFKAGFESGFEIGRRPAWTVVPFHVPQPTPLDPGPNITWSDSTAVTESKS